MKPPKPAIISFKADPALLAAMQGLANRSEFIRSAVLAALDGACPLCRGTGILTSPQRAHWDAFARDHRVRECDDCHELHLVCEHAGAPAARRGSGHARRR